MLLQNQIQIIKEEFADALHSMIMFFIKPNNNDKDCMSAMIWLNLILIEYWSQ